MRNTGRGVGKRKEELKSVGYCGQARKLVKEVEELCEGIIGNSYMETIHPSIHRKTLRLNK